MRLERKLCYDYANLTPKGTIQTVQIRYASVKQHTSVSATTAATSLRRGVDVSSSDPTNYVKKRQSAQNDPDRGTRKRLRRTYGGVSQIPTSCMTQDTHATSPDTGVDLGDDASEEAFQHETEGSPARRATPAEAELLHDVKQFLEPLS